ncbi:MAG: S1/P1 nuclease, partial [Sphingomicrobium sp.]
MRSFLLLLAALCAATSPARAYWEYGHETVARIALDSARPDTRAKIQALLRQGRLLETSDCPVATIEQASVWADCIKPLGDRFAYAYSWHYQNVDICKPFDLKAACKDGHCVSAQIERNARLLADVKVPTRERLMALAFLVHFMGDLAQPMHAGDRGDLGGNRVAANYGLVGGRTNLHSIWDG